MSGARANRTPGTQCPPRFSRPVAGQSAAPSADPNDPVRTCLEGLFSKDGYVDAADILCWDWRLGDEDRKNLCAHEIPLSGGVSGSGPESPKGTFPIMATFNGPGDLL